MTLQVKWQQVESVIEHLLCIDNVLQEEAQPYIPVLFICPTASWHYAAIV